MAIRVRMVGLLTENVLDNLTVFGNIVDFLSRAYRSASYSI
jgi:hypothetical protein